MLPFEFEGLVGNYEYVRGHILLALVGPDADRPYVLHCRVRDAELLVAVRDWLRRDQIIRVEGHAELLFPDPLNLFDARSQVFIADTVAYVAPRWPRETQP